MLAEGEWAQGAYDPETSSIKEQIRNSMEALNKMEPVANVTVPENFETTMPAYNWALELLKPYGYRVDRQGYGTIWFEADQINEGLNHSDHPEERAALALLPRVLKRGIEIGHHGNHKMRQKETITFAAPAIVNGTRINMAVVVTKRKNRYYAHAVLLPDGRNFKFSEQKNNAAQEPLRGVPANRSLAKATSAASTDTITSGKDTVKKQFSFSDTVSKQDVVKDLKDILARGGDPAELRQYVAQMEQNTHSAEQSAANADQTTQELEQILREAKDQGLSVEEYLRWK